MKYIITILLFVTSITQAQVISTLDFSDTSQWSISLSDLGGTNMSTAAGSTITVEKTGAPRGTQIVVTLIGTISTIGYENLGLSFNALSSGNLEYDYTGTGSLANNDGLSILGSGINIITFGIDGTTVETEFTNDALFSSSSSPAIPSSNFLFDAAVNNSQITDLTFTLRIDSSSENLTLSNISLIGTPIPEPSSTLLIGLSLLLCSLRHKRST